MNFLIKVEFMRILKLIDLVKRKNSLQIISLGVIVGAISGFFMSGVSGAFSGIISNKYFSHKAYRLISLKLQSPFMKWLLYTLLTSLAVYIVVLFMKRTGIIKWGLNKKKIKIVLITSSVVLLFLLFINAIVLLFGITGSKKGPNVILIVVDALREDALGINGYNRDTSPNIDEFAGNSIIFKDSYSSSSWTKPSVASLFSALSPIKHNAMSKNDRFPDAINTLAEVLKNSRYNTFFLGGGNPFAGRSFNLDQGFDFYSNKRTNAAELTSIFTSLLPRLKKGKFFTYFHFMDLHLPYNKNKFNYFFSNRGENPKLIPGKIKLRDVRKLAKEEKLTESDKIDLRNLYDGQLKYVDENIGKLLKILKKESLVENTYLIITSDHGEEFWDHGHFEHGHTLYNELIHVPLIIGGNDLKPSVKIKSVRNIDIFPTITDLLKIPFKGSNIDGISFKRKLAGVESGIDFPVFTTGILYGKNKYSLIENKKKIILNTIKKRKGMGGKFRQKKLYEFYDISLDPKERRNLVRVKKVEVSKLIRSLKRYILVNPVSKQKSAIIDEKTRERLKTLGYL